MPTDWSPAALSQDVPAGTVAPGRLGAREIVLWRSTSGRIHAWDERCPHRGMRLSHGFVRGEALSCIYHGWSYGAAGRCLRIPAHPDLTPPEAIRVPACAVAEASGVIWVADAGAARSDPPSFPGFTGFRSLRVEGSAEAVASALGGSGAMLQTKLGPCEVVALIQQLGPGAAGLHLLAPEATSLACLDALSVTAEAVRREIEAFAESAA